MDTMSNSTAADFACCVEWAAEQSWSSGKVGLLGVSYFGGSQWRVAARKPKGLACIIPWEGMSDYYRDRCRQGGIYSNGVGDSHRYEPELAKPSGDSSSNSGGIVKSAITSTAWLAAKPATGDPIRSREICPRRSSSKTGETRRWTTPRTSTSTTLTMLRASTTKAISRSPCLV